MSAKACNRCGGVIVFGKDQDTGRVIPLSVGVKVYRVVRENIVALDTKALVQHVCKSFGPPSTESHFSEPRDLE